MPWEGVVVVFFIGCAVAFVVLAGGLVVLIRADRRRLAALLVSPDRLDRASTIDSDRPPVLSNHGGYFGEARPASERRP